MPKYPPPVDEETKRLFVEMWSAKDYNGRPINRRIDIAQHFGKSLSWVQVMTELTQVSHRKITKSNKSRIILRAEDDREQKRRRFHERTLLRRHTHTLINRARYLYSIYTLSNSSQENVRESIFYDRAIVLLEISFRVVDRRLATVKAMDPGCYMIAPAALILSSVRACVSSVKKRGTSDWAALLAVLETQAGLLSHPDDIG